MKNNPRGVPVDRLASVDETGAKQVIHPAEIKGFFQKRRRAIHWILLMFFLFLPWLTIKGEQALLLDIPNRHFVFFGLTLFSHDAPILFLLLATLTLGLAFVTSVWGRVWCGWACPQTVFVDSFFRQIEILIEGNYLQRKKLDAQEMNLTKFFRRGLKWLLFISFSFLIAHSFAAYFVGTEPIISMIQQSPFDNPRIFAFVMGLTFLIAFDFGWFREQFCIIACPYGRIQSVLMDERSLAVLYDDRRGEPRKGEVPAGKEQGDCVSCYRCVSVCPTGVDIRRGIQLECIACTACIDACDEIMEKVGKPKGLIRYSTEKSIETGKPIQWLRPRSLIYGALTVLMLSGLAYAISTRNPLYAAIIRSIDAPFEVIQGGDVINRFRLHLKNQSEQIAEVEIKLQDLVLRDRIQIVMGTNPMKLKGSQSLRQPIILKFNINELEDLRQKQVHLEIIYKTAGQKPLVVVKPLSLLGQPNS